MKLIKIYGLAFGSAVFSIIITFLIQLIIQPIAASIGSIDLRMLVGISAILLGPLMGIGIPIALIRKKYGKDIANKVLIRTLLFLFILGIILIKLIAL